MRDRAARLLLILRQPVIEDQFGDGVGSPHRRIVVPFVAAALLQLTPDAVLR